MTTPVEHTWQRERWFADDDFNVAMELVLAAARHGGLDVGLALATAARIDDGDADAWVREWVASAGEGWAAARQADAAGHRVSARSHYRQASIAYLAALEIIGRTGDGDREAALRDRAGVCWDRLAELRELPGERIAIAVEDASMPGWFFPAPGSGAGDRRPLLVVDGGSAAHAWLQGGAPAEVRGYHWMTFDDTSGSGEPPLERALVLGAIAEAMLSRDDVDSRCLVVIGVSGGGFHVTRALASEHRFAAAIVDPGIVDLRGSRDHHGASPFRLGDEVRDITTPLLVTEQAGQRRWPAQGDALYELLAGPKELLRLSAPGFSGGDPSALGTERDARIFDWLDTQLGRAESRPR